MAAIYLSPCDGSDLYFPAVRRAARFRDVALSRARTALKPVWRQRFIFSGCA